MECSDKMSQLIAVNMYLNPGKSTLLMLCLLNELKMTLENASTSASAISIFLVWLDICDIYIDKAVSWGKITEN